MLDIINLTAPGMTFDLLRIYYVLNLRG
jgi:hypothetical protein